MTYRIEYLTSVVADDIPSLPKWAKRQIRRAIDVVLVVKIGHRREVYED